MNKYIAEYQGSKVEIMSSSKAVAQRKAAVQLGVPLSRQTHIYMALVERDGKPYVPTNYVHLHRKRKG